jgi:cytochrome c oxidase subunit 4
MSHVVATRIYYGVFAALMVLTAATVWIATINLGFFNPVVALSIALIKATLVVLFFMHLRYSTRLTVVVLVAGLAWLLILLVLTLTDYMTRNWAAYPAQ